MAKVEELMKNYPDMSRNAMIKFVINQIYAAEIPLNNHERLRFEALERRSKHFDKFLEECVVKQVFRGMKVEHVYWDWVKWVVVLIFLIAF